MKNFIVSDLHGNGNIYDSIMGYLENIYNNISRDISLFINGDLIDRGSESARMLIDVRDRIINYKDFKINYLAGNHELMMYQASLDMNKNSWPVFSNWFGGNGGEVTAYGLEDLVSFDEEKEIIKFISNLKIYHKFKEVIDNKNIVLVHAKCPDIVNDNCDLKIRDNTREVYDYLWTRKYLPFHYSNGEIGNKDYFTIIGHTPVSSKYGYVYYKEDNCLNIDGGCAPYAYGNLEYDHTPLVEIDSKNNRLIILTFNNNNEIIYGNYFTNGVSIPINDNELNEYRKYINKDVKVKKLVPYNYDLY